MPHAYGHAHQLEVIVGAFEIGNVNSRQKLENFFISLIMGHIMGGSKFFSKFLSDLSHRRRPRARVWACTPTRDQILWQKLENFFLSNYGVYYGEFEFFSGLLHQRHPRACVWGCIPTRGDFGHF